MIEKETEDRWVVKRECSQDPESEPSSNGRPRQNEKEESGEKRNSTWWDAANDISRTDEECKPVDPESTTLMCYSKTAKYESVRPQRQSGKTQTMYTEHTLETADIAGNEASQWTMI